MARFWAYSSVHDNESSLYYLQSRYYDPQLGRFINADALVATGDGLLGNNMFAYCLNNPINLVDNNGKEPISVSVRIVVVGIVAAAIVIDLGARVLTKFLQQLSDEFQYACARISFVTQDRTEKSEQDTQDNKTQKKKRSLDTEGPPNSDDELYDEEGNLKQQRHYGPDGKAEYDIDYSHSGNYDFPHKHEWNWNNVPPRSGHIPLVK